MPYQEGMGPGNGYGHGYDPPRGYPQQGYPPQYGQAPQSSWERPSQAMAQMQQQMNQMQQLPQIQSPNQAQYYPQHNYASTSNAPTSNGYYQNPSQASHQYAQYLPSPQSYQQSYPPQQFHSPIPQHYEIPQAPVQQAHVQQASVRQTPQSQPPPMRLPQTQAPQPRPILPPVSKPSVHKPHKPSQPKTKQADAISVSNSSVHKSYNHTQPKSQPPDVQMLLVALAEEYFAASHSMGTPLARSMREGTVEQYQKLIATGLGCLEASLTQTHTRLAPRLEARIRLRYAGVLFEETENYMEAETCLSQGITLCEQNRYLDIKYCMQVLLAQLVYKNSPKAALKSLERHCADASAYRHYCWEYVFRFLKASFSMKSSKASDTQAALHDLHAISTLAKDREDHGVYLLSSLMEILVHLTTPSTESKEQIQGALAAAWTYQTTADTSIPQLNVLTHVLDLTCSLVYDLPPQTVQKQKAMEETFKASNWSNSSDTISIPIQKTRAQGQIVSQDTRGLVGYLDDGRDTLMISLLNNNDSFALVYLLSGVALLHNNCTDNKAVKYLREGLLSISGGKVSRKAISTLPEALAAFRWREVLTSYFHVYTVFCYASGTEWKAARDHLKLLKGSLEDLNDPTDDSLGLLHTYLSGLCFQGSGDLDMALEMYRDPSLQLPAKPGQATGPEEQLKRDLSILASLNALWILQDGIQFDPAQNTVMITELEPLCAAHPNKDIQTAFNLVKATVITKPPTPTIRMKNFLGHALDASKSTANKQFLSITLSVMCSKFFVGVVGDQAEKAGRAAVNQAKRAHNTLWSSVANGMLAENLETQGKVEEARMVHAEARRIAALAFPGPS